jgi:hypothetical protein
MSESSKPDRDQPKLDELISLSEAAKLSGLSPNHLRLLAGQGKIWCKKLGRNWFTTEKAVREYLALGIKPGPKPKNIHQNH